MYVIGIIFYDFIICYECLNLYYLYILLVYIMIYRYFIGFDVLEYLVFIYEYYIREVKNLVYVIVDIGFKGFKMDVKCYVRYV